MNKTLTPQAWSWFWLFWICQFLAVELYWLATNARNTLSDTVWWLEGLDKAQPLDFPMWTATHWAIAVTVWLLFAWLSVHLPFGMLR